MNPDSLEVDEDDNCFCKYEDLINYIMNECNTSKPKELENCFYRAVPADYLCAYNFWNDNNLHCIIKDSPLLFYINGREISKPNIVQINIKHHLICDEVTIKLIDGKIEILSLENHEITVIHGKEEKCYSFSKLNYLLIGINQ